MKQTGHADGTIASGRPVCKTILYSTFCHQSQLCTKEDTLSSETRGFSGRIYELAIAHKACPKKQNTIAIVGAISHKSKIHGDGSNIARPLQRHDTSVEVYKLFRGLPARCC